MLRERFNRLRYVLFFAVCFSLFLSLVFFVPDLNASYLPTTGSNVGLGTSTPAGGLTVMNGNVGIGTWSPNSQLEIKGGNASVISTGGTNTNATGAGELYVQGDLEVDGTIYGDGSGITALPSTLVAGGWTDGGTNVFLAATSDNVAIGTTAPTALLTVSSTAAQDLFRVNDNGPGDATPLIVDAAGNVGIGTSSAASKLDVFGSLIFDYTLAGDGILGYNHSSGNQIMSITRQNSPANASLALNAYGGFGIVTNNTSGTPSADFNVYVDTAGNVGISTIAPKSLLEITSNAPQNLFRINDSGAADSTPLVVDSNGNVGIGTSAVNFGKLEVWGTSGASGEPGDASFGNNALTLSQFGSNYGLGLGIVGGSEPHGWIQARVKDSAAAASLLLNAAGGNVGIGTMTAGGRFVVWTGAVGIGTATPVGGTAIMNGNVGIGTWSPASRLHIIDPSTTGQITLGDSAANNYFRLQSQAVLGQSILDSTGVLIFKAASTEVMRLQSRNVGIGTTSPLAGLAVMNGNVGIGTWSPNNGVEIKGLNAAIISTGGTNTNATGAGELYVEGDLEVDGTIYGDGSGITALPTTLAAGGWTDGGTNVFQVTTSDNVGIGTTSPATTLEIVKQSARAPLMISATASGAGDYFKIDSSGNVGIGSTAPNYQVDIGGFNGNNNTLRLSSGSNNAALKLMEGSDAFGFTLRHDGVATNNFQILHHSNDTTGKVALAIDRFSGNVGIGTGMTSASARFAVLGGSVGIGTITPVGGTAIMNGNVGIGTWSPNAQLDVAGVTRVSNIFVGASSGTWSVPDISIEDVLAFRNTGTQSILFGDGAQGARGYIYGLGAGQNITFGTSPNNTVGVERLRITGSGSIGIATTSPVNGTAIMNGNVGIGTWSPNSQLEVKGGNASVISTGGTNTNATGAGELYVQGDLEVDGTIYGDGSGLTALPSTLAAGGWVDGGANMFQSTTSDNVAIGTTLPSAVLDLSSTAAYDLLRINDNGPGDTTPFIIDSIGNVGIGTTTPGSALHTFGYVEGLRLQGTGDVRLRIKTGDTSLGLLMFDDSIAGRGQLGYDQGSDFMFFYTTAIEKMRLTSTGNLGIGTSTVGNRLSVQGNVGIGTHGSAYLTIPAATGALVVEGAVGIGTWVPAGKLDVRGDEARIWTGAGTDTNATGAGELYVEGDLEVDGTIYGDGSGLTALPTTLAAGGWVDGGADVFQSTTSDNVGIGTTTPAAVLDISSAAAYDLLRVNDNGAGDSSPFIINAAGNVGVGTTAPNGLLDVVRGASGATPNAAANDFAIESNTNAGISILTPNNVVGQIVFGDPQGNLQGRLRYNHSDDSFRIFTAGSERVVFDSAGNAGIGTTAAGNRLEIQGGAGSPPNSGSTAGGALRLSQPVNTLVLDMGMTSSTTLGAWLQASSRSNLAQTYPILLNPNGGGVAIGTTSPSSPYTLLVYGSGSSGLRVTGDNANSLTIIGNLASHPFLAGNTEWARIQAPNNRSLAVEINGNNATDRFAVATDPTDGGSASLEVFSILNSGNVGVGTWVPTGRLDVRGDEVRIWTGTGTDTNATGAGELYVQGDLEVDGTIYGDGSGITSLSSSLPAGGWTDGGGSIYNTTTTDYVGIGTSSPQRALHIAAASLDLPANDQYAGNVLITSTDAAAADKGGSIGFGGLYGGAGPWTFASIKGAKANSTASNGDGYLAFYTAGSGGNSSEKGRIDSNGNLGIGTINPTSKLAVSGALAVSDSIFELIKLWNVGGFANIDANSTMRIGPVTSNSILFKTGDVARMRIDTGGNVGIGTDLTSATSRLSVIGGGVGIGTVTPVGGLAIMNGNVGIGTWSPTAALMVQGAPSGNGLYVRAGENTGDYMLRVEDEDGTVKGLYLDSNGNFGLGTETVNNARLAIVSGNIGIGTVTPVNGTAILNGNVGIGTWSPSSALEVKGDNVSILSTGGTNTNATGAGELYVQGDLEVDGTIYGDGSGITALPTTLAAGGWVDGGTNVFQSATSDNVGIGTTSPATTLEILRQSGRAPLMISSTAAGAGDMVKIDSGGNIGVGTTFTTTAALSVMRGNVGIGTTKPPVLFAVGSGVPATATAYNDAYFAHDVEIAGNLYASTVIGGQVLAGDTDLAGYFLRSTVGGLRLAVNANTAPDLYIDTSSRVGVGTSTPTAKLLVENTGADDSLRVNDALLDASPFLIDAAGNVGIGTTTPVGGLAVMNGNVGIGTWKPNSLLNVGSGSTSFGIASNGAVTMRSSASVTGILTANGGMVAQDSVGIGTTLMSSGTGLSVMNGNVGIGTWSPRYALDVTGTQRVSTSSTIGPMVIADGGSNSATFTASGGMRMLSNVYFGSTYNGGTPTITAANQDLIFGSNGSARAVITLASGMGIGTSTPVGGLAVMSGNVGIGTWSPNNGLEVKGVNAAVISTGGTNTNATSPGELYVEGDLEVDGTIYGDGSGITSLSSSLPAGGWTDSGTAVSLTTDTDRVGLGTTLMSAGTGLSIMNGNVGIGTWSPRGPLQISDIGLNTWLFNTSARAIEGYYSSETTPRLQLINNGNANISGNGLLVKYASGGTIASSGVSVVAIGNGELAFGTSNGSSLVERMRINNGGNVGIGTDLTSASSRFAVLGGNVGIGTILPVNGTSIMNGNVGIGTWVPSANLHISKGVSGHTASSTGNLAFFESSGDNGITIGSGVNNTSNIFFGHGTFNNLQYIESKGTNWYLNYNAFNSHVFSIQGVSKLKIDVNGNLGIGTSTPLAGFSVMNGNVGIGTWSPNNGVEIKGLNTALISTGGTNTNATGAGELYVQGDLEVDGTIYGDGSGITSLPSTLAAGGWVDGGTNVYQTTTTDNVGIGTTTPNAATLEIVKNAAQPVLKVSSTATGDGDFLILNSAGHIGIGTTFTTSAALTVMNGNVGIGTWTPTGQFTVGGGGNDLLIDSRIITANYMGIWAGGNAKAPSTSNFALAMSTTNTVINATSSGTIDFRINNAFTPSAMTITNNSRVGIGTSTPVAGLAVMNGNVGIGTWSPNSQLEVKGGNASVISTGGTNTNATGAGELYVQGDLEVDGTIYGDGSGITSLSSSLPAGGWTDSGAVVNLTTDTDRVGIGTTLMAAGTGLSVMNGNVGIGTWSPMSVFHIQTAGISGFTLKRTGSNGTAQIKLENGNTGAPKYWSFGAMSATTNNPDGFSFMYNTQSDVSALLTIGTSGNVGIGTNEALGGRLIVQGGNVGFGTTIPVGGLVVMNGNVGIGTWSPQYQLSLGGDSSANTSLGFAGSGTIQAQTSFMLKTGSREAFFAGFGSSPDIRIGNHVDYETIALYTDAIQTMTLTDQNVGIGTSTPNGGLTILNGNVGIGTWSPNSQLEVKGGNASVISTGGTNTNATGAGELYVQGDLEVDGTIYGDGSGITSLSSSLPAGGWTDSGSAVSLTTDTDRVGIGTTLTAAGTGLSVMNGNVGIGTWSANQSFDVKGAVQSSTYLYTGNGYGIGFGGSNNTAIIAAANGDMRFWVGSAAERMRITTGGNVGIGTTTPITLLEVTSTASQNLFRVNDNGPADSTPFLIDEAGRVGIGTTDPLNQLDVSGNIRAVSSSENGGSSRGVLIGPSTFDGTHIIRGYNNNGGRLQIETLNTGGAASGNTVLSLGAGGTSSDIRFSTSRNSSAVERMRIDASGNVGIGTTTPLDGTAIMNGNVGIGTWSPNAQLEVKGGNASVISTGGTNTNATGAGELYVQGDLEVDGTIYGDGSGITSLSSSLPAGGWTDSGSAVSLTTDTDRVGIGTTLMSAGTGLSVMNGNVGIGTWNPDSQLSLGAGTGMRLTAYQGTSASFSYGLGIQSNVFQIIVPANGSADIVLGRGTSAALLSLMTIKQGGSVGIGTTTPVGGTAIMNGNVGIGTWSPRSGLEVKGPGVGQITIDGPSGGCLMFRDTDNGGWTECNALDGGLTCSVDADGVCDGS